MSFLLEKEEFISSFQFSFTDTKPQASKELLTFLYSFRFGFEDEIKEKDWENLPSIQNARTFFAKFKERWDTEETPTYDEESSPTKKPQKKIVPADDNEESPAPTASTQRKFTIDEENEDSPPTPKVADHKTSHPPQKSLSRKKTRGHLLKKNKPTKVETVEVDK